MDYFRGAKNALYNTYTGIATKVKGVCLGLITGEPQVNF